MFEFIRFTAQLPYSETELKEKSLTGFWGILERAEKKVSQMKRASEKAGRKGK